MGRIVVASFAVLFLPVLAAAQSRGFAPAHTLAAPTSRAASVSRAVPFHTPAAQSSPRFAPRFGTLVSGRTGRAVRRANRVLFNSGQVDFQDVPGLGFDYPHLAAVSGNRRNHGSRFNGGFPFGFGGFLLSPSVVVEEPPAADSPSAAPEEVPLEAASDDPVERLSHSRARASAPSESLAAPAPQPDAEQFVFVRRDGSLVFAIAYSWDNGSLRYVTPEGFRRTIASDALDLGATQQFNEQRGLTFRWPA